LKGVRDGETIWVKTFGWTKTSCSPLQLVVGSLYPDSEMGFTSFVGLGQGRFLVQFDPDGGRKIRSPFPHLEEELSSLDLERFEAMVERTRR
jgi:hypothetical protein